MAWRRDFLDRYGRELEWDFHDVDVDIVDFWRGRHSWGKFDSLVERFDLQSDSYLSWARANDVDRFRQARDAGVLTRGKPRKPETFEFGQAEQLLSGIYLLLQQVIHTTAQKGAKHPKKFKGHPWPSVATAIDALELEDKKRVAEANRAFMAMFEFVPQDEFDAELAEHVEALEAGAERSPVQERAEAAAWGQPVPSASPAHAPAFSDSAPPVIDDPAGQGWADWPSNP